MIMKIKEQVLAELPATAEAISRKTGIELPRVQKCLSNQKSRGVVRIIRKDGNVSVWGQLDKTKRKYTRRKKKKIKRAGLLLQVEMLETRVGNIEQLLGVDQI